MKTIKAEKSKRGRLAYKIDSTSAPKARGDWMDYYGEVVKLDGEVDYTLIVAHPTSENAVLNIVPREGDDSARVVPNGKRKIFVVIDEDETVFDFAFGGKDDVKLFA